MLVNQNGTLNTSNYYYPYGGNRGGAQSTLTAKRYTGQYHEAGLAGSQGLYYYNARWYDPQLARFAQADTIVPDATSPQAFNRYSYVTGNPLRYTDPTGHYEFEESPDDEYFISAATGIMPARRSRSPHAYTSTERRKLILRQGRRLKQSERSTSLEKFARLTEYAAQLYESTNVDAYMADVTHVINGWSNSFLMARLPFISEKTAWLGNFAFGDWGGWASAYVDDPK